MKNIYLSRPFKTRNADEYDLEQVLNLFVSPTMGLTTPFDYENNIIKGRMGSGKTMYLRANHAYHLYSILPSLIHDKELILPVLIRLSDFQHLGEPGAIYRGIIIKIIEELSSIYLHLQNAEHLARIHLGIRRIPTDLLAQQKMASVLTQLQRLGADEYIQRVVQQNEVGAAAKAEFFELSAKYQREKCVELQHKPNPGIKDVEECYRTLLADRRGKVILLIDEAGALDRRFFRSDSGDSFFEILMNQLRTAEFIRTKVAIYPNSYQDILTETRYGDVVVLEESIHDSAGYTRLRAKAIDMITRYINGTNESHYSASDLFETADGEYGDVLEQILYASGGNLRRMIQILDLVMDRAYQDHNGEYKVTLEHGWEAMQRQSQGTEGFYSDLDRDFLESIAKACRNRKTYRFTFPYMSPALNKFTSKSQEYNLLNIVEFGAGRRGTTYCFDYSYCVTHDLPTHHMADTERINKDRTLNAGPWITRVATLSADILKETSMGKMAGKIKVVSNGRGFISADDGVEYFFWDDCMIPADKGKTLKQDQDVRYVPLNFNDTNVAMNVELLT